MNGDLVGRNSSGVATAGQSLGTVAFPWGTVYADGFVLNGSAIDTSSIAAPVNRVVSGKVRAASGSNWNQFLVPNGAALSAILDGTPTNLVLDINGSAVTFSTDVTKTGLTAAPSSNNTCLVDMAAAADQFDTKRWGTPSHRYTLTVDNMGSEITALIGQYAAFKIAGTSDEYFIAFVESSTSLTQCLRGCFYDSTLAPVKAAGFSNNDTITLMKLTWWFAENDGATVDVSYTNPVWSFTAPGSPVTGDYWYDMSNNVWKRYDGATFQTINRTFIGWTIQDSTNCVAARCEDSYANFKTDHTLGIVASSTSIAIAKEIGGEVNVAGTRICFGNSRPTWNITTNLAAAADLHDATEQSGRFYYLYLKKTGATVLSDIFPFHNRQMGQWIHPYNMWRCVGVAYNNASGDFAGVGAVDGDFSGGQQIFSATTGNGYGSGATKTRRFSVVAHNDEGAAGYDDDSTNGATVQIGWPGLWFIEASEVMSNTANVQGYTVNATAGNLDIQSTVVDESWYNSDTANGFTRQVTRKTYFYVGDVIRSQTGGLSNSTSFQVNLSLARVRG